jgi:hypothetical protein
MSTSRVVHQFAGTTEVRPDEEVGVDRRERPFGSIRRSLRTSDRTDGSGYG